MAEKKDRRSKRDKLGDKLIGDIEKRIAGMEEGIAGRVKLNEMEQLVVDILKDQVEAINKMCEKEGDENKP